MLCATLLIYRLGKVLVGERASRKGEEKQFINWFLSYEYFYVAMNVVWLELW